MSRSNASNVFKEFCSSTSLHGYSYLNNADSFVSKIAWVFVILTATGFGIMFLTFQTKAYLAGTVLTSIETFSAPLKVRIN